MAIIQSSRDTSAPIGDLNTTPLIDVMLVLLVMMIITLPKMTHAVKVDLPQNCATADCNKTIIKPINTLAISASSRIYWNNQEISADALTEALSMSTRMNPMPELRFMPDADAPYSTVNKVLALTRGSGIEEIGFVGNERYQRSF